MLVRKTVQALAVLAACCNVAIAEDAEAPKQKSMTREELTSKDFNKKISEAYGHLVQKSLENPVLTMQFDSVVKGMQDEKAGKPSPLSEQEYEEAVQALQEFAFQEMAKKNLDEAEAYLKDNASKKDITQLESGKVQYVVVQPGTGKPITQDTVAEINYKGQYANGTVFGSSEESGGPLVINLNQTIPGFKVGMMGMKEGEKRRLFIHPELGYGTSGQLMPNALLIFDVEVLKVKDKPAADDDMSTAGGGDLVADDYDGSDEMDGPDHDDDGEQDHDINMDSDSFNENNDIDMDRDHQTDPGGQVIDD